MSTQERSDDSGEHGYGSAKQDENIDAAKEPQAQSADDDAHDDAGPSPTEHGEGDAAQHQGEHP